MPSIFSDASQNGGRKPIRTFNEHSVYPVIEPERLLSSIHRKRIIEEIKEVAELPDEYFDTLYRNLIESFTAFVQILPVNNEARLSSILDEGLLRALFALQVQQKSSKDEIEPLMSYVLFSACLLFDIASVIENRTIVISEQGGSYIRIWEPVREGSLPIAGYYRIRRGGGLTPWSCRRSAVSLATRLIPQTGYDWIFQNPHAFNMWIALLSEDKEGAGVLSLYIDRAREMLEEFKTTVEYFVQTAVEEFEPKDTKDADLFLDWYLQELEKGNQQLFQITDDKILITQDVIKRYASTNKKISADKILDELEKLGFISGESEVFYSSRQKALQSTFVKQHGFGAGSSLFGVGKEELGEKAVVELVTEKVENNRVVSPEDQLRASGGRTEGYVVNMALGLVLPASAYNSSVNLVSSTQQQALANQLPNLDSAAKSQDAFQQANQQAKVNLDVKPVLAIK